MANRRSLLFSLGLAMLVWLTWYLVAGGTRVLDVVAEYWPMSLTMVFGSFIAGATSEGGGAVAFPVFTKLLAVSPADARVFSLAIQSVGMTAATLVIIVMRVQVDWRTIRWASLGGVAGIVVGAVWLAPVLPPALVKMLFTVLVTSLAVVLYVMNRCPREFHATVPVEGWTERRILLLAGFCGGLLSGIVGNGIDIITFSVMVLLFRVSEKVATPTSVILMACNALAGFLLHLLWLGGFSGQVQAWWLASIPVVVVGAPFGAMVCSRLDRHVIAWVLIVLIMIELLSSLWIIPMTPLVGMVSLAALSLFLAVYWRMYHNRRYLPPGQG
jgi:uncharacterized membrane protein YfcA